MPPSNPFPYAEASRGRALKKKALVLLTREDWPASLEDLRRLPGSQVVNPLMSYLLHPDEEVRWRSVIAIGAVVTHLAEEDVERARVIMRRFMWTLNDESGGIGWGAPESMAETMAHHEGLAREYASVFVSYLNPEGNFLEYKNCFNEGYCGALFGLLRSILDYSPERLSTWGHTWNPEMRRTRGFAAWAAGLFRGREYREKLSALLSDGSRVRVYTHSGFEVHSVGELAAKALSMLDRD